MTAAQKERIAADFTIAFIHSGKIKSYKESVKVFHKIQDHLSQPQNENAKPATKKTPAKKSKTN